MIGSWLGCGTPPPGPGYPTVVALAVRSGAGVFREAAGVWKNGGFLKGEVSMGSPVLTVAVIAVSSEQLQLGAVGSTEMRDTPFLPHICGANRPTPIKGISCFRQQILISGRQERLKGSMVRVSKLAQVVCLTHYMAYGTSVYLSKFARKKSLIF